MRYVRIDKGDGKREECNRKRFLSATVSRGYHKIENVECAEARAQREGVTITLNTDWALWDIVPDDNSETSEQGFRHEEEPARHYPGD